MEITKQSENRPPEFQGEATFGFSGEWLVEVEAKKELKMQMNQRF